jgi:hypothetical protein
MKGNQTPMNKIVHYIGLGVHKESIAVSIAPQHSTEVRRYGIIGGTTRRAILGRLNFWSGLMRWQRAARLGEPSLSLRAQFF